MPLPKMDCINLVHVSLASWLIQNYGCKKRNGFHEKNCSLQNPITIIEIICLYHGGVSDMLE